MPAAKKKLGKANSLPGQRWSLWLDFMREQAGGKYWLLLWLSSTLCLRVTQVARLKTSDFQLKKAKVWIGSFKKHAGTFKPLLPSVLKVIKKIKRSGVKSSCCAYKWPREGLLFPSRKGSRLPHMSKDTVGACIRRFRKSFVQKYKRQFPDLCEPQAKAIRSHSGRRHCVSKMSSADMSPNLIMGFAQIESYRVFRQYVDMDTETLSTVMNQADRKLKLGKA